MAVLLSRATGNLTTASTWGLVDSTSYLNSETGSASVPTSAGASARSSGTTTGAITIDAIAVKLAQRNGTTGTITAELWNNTDSVVATGTTVTINTADLPSATSASVEGGWIVFKMSAPVTLTAAKSYMVQLTTSNASQAVFWTNATPNNWSRALRTTTTQAPVAGDDMIVAGEHTGAGTGNDLTVTNNQTAATDYGSNTNSTVTPAVSVCKRGTLKWADGSAGNPYLRLSGHLIVYSGGTLNVGTTGTPIPRDSTAILEFDPAADGDMGLIGRNGATVNIQGLSRTSGKNIVSCKLNADAPGTTNIVAVNSATAVGGSISSTSTNFSDPTGYSPGANFGGASTTYASALVDTAVNTTHLLSKAGSSIAGNTTQVFSVWLARGNGTNNRFVRMLVGNSQSAAPTNGFYADIDLQAGTIGTCTAVGNGTATSSAITAYGSGYICTIIGAVSSATATPNCILAACSAAGTVTYTGDATQNFAYYGMQLYTASSLPSAVLTVDTDTGWLTNDVVAIASTTRTAAECEPVQLSTGASSTTITPKMSVISAHSGTSPTQAEIILLTRNVKIRSTSATLMAYCFFDTTATVDIDWAQFYYLGENAANKRGVEIGTTTGSFSMQFSSIHDCEDFGVYLFSGLNNNITFSSNAMWNCATVTGPAINVAAATTGVPVFDSNIIMRTLNSNCVTLSDIGLTFTNNTMVGATTNGMALSESSVTIGTFSGNVVHSCGSSGISWSSTGSSGTISGGSIWRNTGTGVTVAATSMDNVIDGVVIFGNTVNNISITTGGFDFALKNLVVSGDTTFSTSTGLNLGASQAGRVIVDSCDFGTASGIKAAHTQDINVSSFAAPQVIMRNTKLASSTEVASSSNLRGGGFISSQKHDQTAGNHMFWLVGGKGQTDTTFFNTASPSIRLTPTSASIKMESAPKDRGMQVAMANGATATVSAYIRKSAVGDGAAYNGNQPRLIQRANPALGQNSDVVLATYSGGTGSWAQISGTTSSPTDDGCWEIVVDADGTAGWINVDDFAVT